MRSLARDLLVRLLWGYLVVGVAVTGVQVFLKYVEQRGVILDSLNMLATTFSPGLEAAIWDYQTGLTQNQVDGIGTNEAVVRVVIQDTAGEILAKMSKPGSPILDTELTIVHELWHEKSTPRARLLGTLTLSSSPALLAQSLQQNLVESVLVLLAMLLFLVITVWGFTRAVVVAPLTRFTRQVRELAHQRPLQRSIDLGAQTIVEFKTLQDGFNNLLSQVDAHQSAIEQRVEERTRELVAAKNQAEEANRVKSSFLANMSHELRTPMHAILGFSSLLAETELRSDQKELLDVITTSSASLLAIINDILDFSKIEAGKMAVETVPCSPVDLVSAVTLLLKPQALSKGLAFQSTTEDAPELILGDPLRLQQILTNLVGNAIKFTHQGQVHLRVVSLNAPKRLRFEVADTGIGMTAEESSRIFQSFSQADSSMTRRFGGTGLGLAISVRLAELMHGSIGLVTEKGVGSTFWLEIPILEASAPGPVPPEVPLPTHDFTGVQILLVDDNELNLFVAQKILQKAGATVTTASGGRESVEAFGRSHFDLILMDVQMPGMDGYEATAVLRRQSEVPIVAMTAHAMSGAREECLAAGMNDYVTKPIAARDLLEVVAQWVRLSPKP